MRTHSDFAIFSRRLGLFAEGEASGCVRRRRRSTSLSSDTLVILCGLEVTMSRFLLCDDIIRATFLVWFMEYLCGLSKCMCDEVLA